nr:NADH-quinone oxidoreductase subunit C [Rhizobium phaseoli]
MAGQLPDLASHILTKRPRAVRAHHLTLGELTLLTDRDHLIELLGFLRDDGRCLFSCLLDICGVDWPARTERFDVVYHLLSPSQNLRVRIKLSADGDTPVPSACALFPCADWYEREAWDMYGILFTGHPDLRRLLTDYGFEGHPLRKDFPLTGFVEVRYDDAAKRVIYEPVELKQEYRHFEFLSPWEGTDYHLPGDEKTTLEPPKQ